MTIDTAHVTAQRHVEHVEGRLLRHVANSPQQLRRVIIESPLAGAVAENLRYAKAAVRDALGRGEAPFASHLLYAQHGILDDAVPAERRAGIEAGLTWSVVADLVAVYQDRGISGGMREGIERATAAGIAIEYRTLGHD
jgi:hypothetical protein